MMRTFGIRATTRPQWKARSLLCFCLVLLLAGCMTERVHPDTEYPAVPDQATFLVKKTDYDNYGRPLFTDRLAGRPGKAGEVFTIVHTVHNRPARSFDIAIVEHEKADMNKPLAVIYEWTGKGFEGGMVISQGVFPGGFSGSGSEVAAYLAIKAAPLVIGGVTGFVVGLVASIPETAGELIHVIVNARERVIAYTIYEYDEKGRIKFMKLYPPDGHAEELVKTVFYYTGDSDVPSRTDVTSRVEKKVRTIQYQ
jgi:hypothetical protein